MGKKEAYSEFQTTCGKALIALERYKLKTNLLGCNMNEEQFKKYYTYYEGRPNKRLQTSRKRIQQMMQVFQKNALFLHGLELKTLNNMFKNYRRKMDLSTNQPTEFNYAKFNNQETELLEAIIYNDLEKMPTIQNILIRIQLADNKYSSSLSQNLQKNKPDRGLFEKAIKTISRAQIRYCRYYQAFERSMVNMVNQLHSHLQKLSQFYTVWDNLGSSMIFQLKSDRELIIEKNMDARQYRGSYETEDQIRYMIDILPANSRLKNQYEEKLKNLEQRKEDTDQKYSGRGNLAITNRGKIKSLRENMLPLQKANWYENINNCRRPLEPLADLILCEKDQSFFKYTFQELHAETLDYLQELKKKRADPSCETKAQEEVFFQRFYKFHDNKERNKASDKFAIKLQKFNVPPQMSFKFWYDRFGAKGYFTIQDFPMNLVQKKIEFQLDRQTEMLQMDEKIKKQYNAKENKMGNTQFQHRMNFGYKYINCLNELDYLKSDLTSRYDPQYLPKPKKEVLKIKKNQEEDFSSSDDQAPEEKKIKIKEIIQSDRKEEKYSAKKNCDSMVENDSAISDLIKISDKINKRSIGKASQELNGQQINNHLSKISWISTKQRIKDDFQNFFQIFLVKQQILSSKKMQKLKQESSDIEFKYIEHFSLSSLQESINKDELANTYLLNKNWIIKIQPRVFSSKSSRLHIQIFLMPSNSTEAKNEEKKIPSEQVESLKQKLSSFFKNLGICLFQQSQLEQTRQLSLEDRRFFLLGYAIKEQKKIFENTQKEKKEQSKQDVSLIVSIGRNKFQEFKDYHQRFNKIEI